MRQERSVRLMRSMRRMSWMRACPWTAAVMLLSVGCSSKPDKAPAPTREVALEEQVEKAADRAVVAGERAAAEVRTKAPEGMAAERVEKQAAVANAQAQQKEMQKGAADAAIVRWQQLTPFAPKLLGKFRAISPVDGRDRVGPGPRMAAVRRVYERGTTRATLQVIDALIAKTLQAPFDVTASINEETDNGFKRSLKVGGMPGILEYRAREESSRLAVMAGGRFLVDVRVNRAQAGTDAQDLAAAIDLASLAVLRANVGAPKGK